MSTSLSALLRDADAARDSRQLTIAADLYKRYLDARPWAAGIWNQYAYCLRERGDHAGADLAYAKAARIRPWHARTYLLIGQLRDLQQRQSNALFWYQLAAALKPGLREAHTEAQALEAQGISRAAEPLPAHWLRGLVPMILRRYSQRATTARMAIRTPAAEPSGSPDTFEEAWRQYLPAFIEASSNVAALGHEYAKLRRDVDGIMKALGPKVTEARGRAAPSDRTVADPSQNLAGARIIAQEKVAFAKRSGTLRISIGDGCSFSSAGANRIRVSAQELPGTDIVARAYALPFDHNTLDEVVAIHVLEHYRQEVVERYVLPHWLSLLKPDGRLAATVLDAPGMAKAVADGRIAFETYRSIMLDDTGGTGRHLGMYSCESLSSMLERVGFQYIEVAANSQLNDACPVFCIHARAPE